MRNPLRFFIELMEQPVWVSLWVLFLMLVNIASLAFWQEAVAQLILMNFLASAMLMMGLYARFGFTKILGLGHVPWIPLLAYVVTQIPAARRRSNAICWSCRSLWPSPWCSIRLMFGTTSEAGCASNSHFVQADGTPEHLIGATSQ
ncbi:MAG: hypothetical protein AAB433_08600 [Nitrospirota bacterium]